MNASEFIYGSLHLFDPILNAEFSPQGIALRQFSSRWEGGMVRTSGNWLRAGNALVLDDTAFAGLEYTLPANWKQLWMTPLPAWLQSLTLKKFSASRNLIIDVDPAFPWQITALDGYGGELQLVKNGSWGVWNGSATLNAAAATFNRIDVRRPSLKLNATASTVNITELSAFTERGILQATAAVSQLPQRQVNLSFSGRGVPLNILPGLGLAVATYKRGWQSPADRQRQRAGRCPAQTDDQRAAQRREYGETAGGANHAQRRGQPRPRRASARSRHPIAMPIPSPLWGEGLLPGKTPL